MYCYLIGSDDDDHCFQHLINLHTYWILHIESRVSVHMSYGHISCPLLPDKI